MIKGVSHVSLSVTDLDRSLSFYRDVLELDVLAEPYEGVVFEAGWGSMIELRDPDDVQLELFTTS